MGVFDSIKKIVSGDVAHDAADSGAPIKIGGKALTALPSAVSANDRVDAYFDEYGRQIVGFGASGGEIYSLAARTGSPTWVLQKNAGAQGIYIMIYVSAVADTPSVTPQLVLASPLETSSISTPYKVVWQASAITDTGTYVYLLHPGVVDWVHSGYTGIDAMAAIPIPNRWALTMNHADADSITYQVLYSYIP